MIDEISRGDPSQIFGDFLTYIDKDYREDEFRLSYSGKPISVPDNLIIVGTTNPYDRSVAELDDALLRRFHMIEFKPDRKVLEAHFKEVGLDGAFADRVLRLFSEVDRLMPHGFGHAHFMRLERLNSFRKNGTESCVFLLPGPSNSTPSGSGRSTPCLMNCFQRRLRNSKSIVEAVGATAEPRQ